jgi:hypothetical protein
MKRKAPALVAVLLFSLFLLPAADTLRTMQLRSPLKNIAYSGEFSDVIVNSAAFPFRTDNLNFYFSSELGEKYSRVPFADREKFPGIQNLGINNTISFGSNNLVLSGAINQGISDRTYNSEEDALFFDIDSYFRLQVDFAYRLNFFAFGARLEGGNQSRREQRPVDSLNDILANTFFERFQPVPNSEYFAAGVSTFFQFSWLNLTLTVDELIKVGTDGNLVANWSQIADSLCFGLGFESPRYKEDGNLHFIRCRLGLGFEHFLSTENAVSEVSADINVQLLPDVSVILGAGIRNRQILGEALRNLSREETLQTFELKGKFLAGSVSLSVSYPLSFYDGWNDELIEFGIKGAFYI